MTNKSIWHYYVKVQGAMCPPPFSSSWGLGVTLVPQQPLIVLGLNRLSSKFQPQQDKKIQAQIRARFEDHN